jgi:hypothetical protein
MRGHAGSVFGLEPVMRLSEIAFALPMGVVLVDPFDHESIRLPRRAISLRRTRWTRRASLLQEALLARPRQPHRMR